MSELKQQVKNRYASFIASICNNAIEKTVGISKESNLVKSRIARNMLKDKNVHVYFDDNNIIIDMYVNVDFGISIPEVVCSLQELIKNDVEKETSFSVKQININVTNINL
ncbi:MAG TPA: Asp23/Gls24 family envelope stress response protein [Clostridiales bacterium]|nr:Asp23/Gls24 family envelope stress response protein [Clostridiales bacterium]